MPDRPPMPSFRLWLTASLRSFVVSFIALAVTLWLLPGEQVTAGALSVAALAVVVLLCGAVLRPLVVRLTAVTGLTGLLLAGVLTQAVVLGIALAVVPTVERFTFSEIFLAAWATAVVAALVNWIFDASSEEVFLAQVFGHASRVARRHPVRGPGLLVVQLDGVSEPLLRQAITSGAMPAVSRLLQSGSHRLRGWHTGIPATTPAGQAVLLHGEVDSVPGYRWFDKQAQRLYAAGRAADVADVERRFSTGRGLLADGGASVSNIFSGDAGVRTLTVSDARAPNDDSGAISYVVGRSGLVRSLVLLVGQMIAEWFQGRRQRRRDVRPRVSRTGAFLVLRGLTTVVLRDFNVSVVAQQMARGTPVVYVDFVDYDEVAHHAGPSRPEAIRTLESLDRVVEFFLDLDAVVGRDYEVALVSDHGQAQGTPFRQQQVDGLTLDQVVQSLTAESADHASTSGEPWMPASLLLAGAGRRNPVARIGRRVATRRQEDTRRAAPVVVAVSGSLAHLYLADVPGRVVDDVVRERYPGLIPGLAERPGVGAVLVRRADGVLTAYGARGWRVFTPDGDLAGEGEDPLLAYGPEARADVWELDRKHDVGDLILLGAYDRTLGEVAAFEELVGSHGGLGAWQTRALLIHPAGWTVPDGDPLTGVEVHRTLVGRLAELGLREPT